MAATNNYLHNQLILGVRKAWNQKPDMECKEKKEADVLILEIKQNILPANVSRLGLLL